MARDTVKQRSSELVDRANAAHATIAKGYPSIPSDQELGLSLSGLPVLSHPDLYEDYLDNPAYLLDLLKIRIYGYKDHPSTLNVQRLINRLWDELEEGRPAPSFVRHQGEFSHENGCYSPQGWKAALDCKRVNSGQLDGRYCELFILIPGYCSRLVKLNV